MAIRVVLADDSLLVREGLQQLLAAHPGVVVVASCNDLPSLVQAVETMRPNVVVTDIRMPPTNRDEGIQVAVLLRRSDPDVGVIVLSQYADPSLALRLLESGSAGRGYLLKERMHDQAQLISAIEAVAEGGSAVDPKIVDALVSAKSRAEHSPLVRLTPREQEVLAGLAQGKSNAAIAESLVLSKGAVEKYINAIFLKLGLSEAPDVSKRVKAVLMFLAEENVPPGDEDAASAS